MFVAHSSESPTRTNGSRPLLGPLADPESVTTEPVNYRKVLLLKTLSTPSAAIHSTLLELVKNNDVTDGSGGRPVLVAFSTGPPHSAKNTLPDKVQEFP